MNAVQHVRGDHEAEALFGPWVAFRPAIIGDAGRCGKRVLRHYVAPRQLPHPRLAVRDNDTSGQLPSHHAAKGSATPDLKDVDGAQQTTAPPDQACDEC